MSKFPLLNFYRILAQFFSVLLFVGGMITAVRAGFNASFDGFDLGVFITTVIPFLLSAFGLGVAAELILLLFQVVEHLEHIRYVTDRQAARESNASPAAATPPRISSPTPAFEPTVRVRAKTTTSIRTKPDSEAAASSQLASGQSLPIYGRTSDNLWFTISRQGTLWLDAADVEIIEGYLSNLSVVTPG